MKKDKIKYNCLTGIILIIFNISMKFLIYGNTAIWLDDMPTYPSEDYLLKLKYLKVQCIE